jgi:hypothetical protein
MSLFFNNINSIDGLYQILQFNRMRFDEEIVHKFSFDVILLAAFRLGDTSATKL